MLERIYKITCDNCGKSHEMKSGHRSIKQIFGTFWIALGWRSPMGTRLHHCPDCSTKLSTPTPTNNRPEGQKEQ
jgi:DNA-directed RNA polymerase subunit RPC12/RpoP